MHRMLLRLVLVALLLATVSCNRKATPEEEVPPAPGAPEEPTGEGTDKAAADDNEPAQKMLPKHALKKGPIVVGGCKEACEDPKNAFRNFVRALFEVQEEDRPDVTRYIDTTTLVDNGRELGSHWADLWIMKRKEERRKEVEAWFAEYRARVGKTSDRQVIEEALASTMEFQRISSVEVEIRFVAPTRTGSSNADQWRFLLGKRGLEWLVKAIYD